MPDINTRYDQTLNYLYEKLPMFSRLGKAAIKHDLTNTLLLCEAVGNPHTKFKSIHIAGTNGKGSVSHMLAAILQESGYKTGLYTSPHLVDFRERIRINGIMVSKEWVVDFVDSIKDAIDKIQPSFFEVTVVMAFKFFEELKVDVAVIETGLGGRVDSTNVITPVLSIITNISYDHQDLLGDTLPKIASEKAGIIKPNVPVLIGEEHEETERVFVDHAIHNKSTIYYAEALWDMVRTGQDGLHQYFKAVHRGRRELYDIATDMLGNYQRQNIRTVLAAVEVLIANQGVNISMPIVKSALSKVKQLTGLRGRWEVIQQSPLIIVDVGHNAAGMQEVMQQWKFVKAEKKHIVVGFVKDKDITASLQFFPKDAQYYFCNAKLPRALPAAELQKIAGALNLQGATYDSVQTAVEAAKAVMTDKDALLVTGSFFVVGEAMEQTPSIVTG